MRRRGYRLGLITGGVVVLAGLYVAWVAWRFQSELVQAKQQVAQRDFEPARRRLAALAASTPAWAGGEAHFWLGYCEWVTGHRAEALQAFGRVPRHSEYSLRVAFFETEDALDNGRLRAAEECLERGLVECSAGSNELRAGLIRIYRMEARFDDVRRMLRASFEEARDPIRVLNDLWVLDRGTVSLDNVQKALDIAGGLAPDDDRVWLGRACVATKLGRFDEAYSWLTRCQQSKADEVVWRAWLQWARACDRPDEALKALRAIGAKRFEPAERLAWRAWLLNQAGDSMRERDALEQWLSLEPQNTEALERLAALLLQAGDAKRTDDVRQRRANVDRTLDEYRQRMRSGDRFPKDADRLSMGRLAEALGRRFDARAWYQLALKAETTNAEARAKLNQLDQDQSANTPAPRSAADPWADLGTEIRTAHHTDPAGVLIQPEFVDDAQSAGLRFTFSNGESIIKQTPDTLSGGVGVIDYDGDGWLDVYVVQGGPFPPDPDAPNTGDRLFRNRGDGSFQDTTDQAGISSFPRGYGHGVAVGDFDNDGHPDLFVTRWRSYALYRNRGDGRFEDVTEAAGLGGDRDWPTSAAWADLDGDGDLDLYVCHYLAWDPAHPRPCRDGTTNRYIHCNPRDSTALPDRVFRNDGGRFVDVTSEAGCVDRDGRGLGVLAADLDDDNLIDLFVANDETANFLWHNRGGFRFEELAHARGVAGNAAGGYQAGMGVACGDLDGDGRPDLAVTNFYGESTTFYQNLGDGFFADRTAAIGLAAPSRYLLGFGVAFLDVNNDSLLDLITANGHLDDLGDTPYRMPLQLFVGTSGGRLQATTASAGTALAELHLGRALATGDLDNDGRVDVLIVALNDPLIYLHNTTREPGHFVTFRLEGRKSNRDGIGARVAVHYSGHRQTAQRVGGGSYQSACDPRLHFGLGAARHIDRVEVRWPSGQIDNYRNLDADTGYLIIEGAAEPKPLAGFQNMKQR